MTLKQMVGSAVILILVAFDYIVLIPDWNAVGNGLLNAFPTLCMKGGGCLATYIADINYALQAVIVAVIVILFIFTIVAPWIREPDTGQLPMGGYRALRSLLKASVLGVMFDIAGFFVTLFIFAMIWIPLDYVFNFGITWETNAGFSNEYLFIGTITSIVVWWPMVILISCAVGLWMGAQKRRLQEI